MATWSHGSLCLTFAVLVTFSDAPSKVCFIVVTGALLTSCLAPHRSIMPRWVIRLTDQSLFYQDICSKRVTELQLASISEARINRRTTFGSGGEGGISFHDELVLEVLGRTVVLPLPRFECFSAKTLGRSTHPP